MKHLILTMLIAAVPVIELRGAIPYGVTMGLSPATAFCAAVLGNLMPVPIIILFVRKVFDFLRNRPFWKEKIIYLERKANLKGRAVRKYRVLGLMVLVAIPLPGTGAWTGALVAALLEIRLRTALPTIFVGLLLAGSIMLTITYGVGTLL
ncbi:small multi-drug export protein [Oscillibacter valericigenes]|nr:small multi-drug export protein [Oscillibacter valericigenes]